MVHSTLLSFITLILASQALGRILEYYPNHDLRGEDENDYSKKKNSFALSSIDESNDLSDAEFMRDVLKGIALDLAVLRRTVKKTSTSLDHLSEQSTTFGVLDDKGGPYESKPQRQLLQPWIPRQLEPNSETLPTWDGAVIRPPGSFYGNFLDKAPIPNPPPIYRTTKFPHYLTINRAPPISEIFASVPNMKPYGLPDNYVSNFGA